MEQSTPQTPSTPQEQGTPQPLRNRNTSHSKYEVIKVLAKKGMKQHEVVALTIDDIESNGKSTLIKGIKLTLEEAKTFAAYLHEHGAGIVSYIFYGNDATVQCSVPSLRKALGTHLKRTDGTTLEDIG